MPTDRARLLALAPMPLLLAGCYAETLEGDVTTFGEANRQTLAAQVIDPDPQYETVGFESSGLHATQAIDRYSTDKVKQPESVSSTTTSR